MTVTEFVQLVNDLWAGDSDAPVDGSDDWNRIIRLANMKRRNRARKRNVSWKSHWREFELGTISSGTQTYDLEGDETIHKLSDYVYVDQTDDNTATFQVIKANQREGTQNVVYVTGSNPMQLTFTDTIESNNPIVGGILRIPCYVIPDDLANASDELLEDEGEWLAYAVAAEMAFNDPSKDDHFSDLLGQANDMFEDLLANNQETGYAQPNQVATSQDSVGESW